MSQAEKIKERLENQIKEIEQRIEQDKRLLVVLKTIENPDDLPF